MTPSEPVDHAIAGRVDAGESPSAIAAALGLPPSRVVAALGALALGPEGSAGPPLVQVDPPRPAWRAALDEAALVPLFPLAPRPALLTLAAGLLQVHDFWEASHQAAQSADDLGEARFSAYWHGIAHRREPDPGNAQYWFRRVGRHPLFEPLGRAARSLLSAQGDPGGLADRLAPAGRWEPTAFIRACGDRRDEATLRRLQRLEMALLLEATAAALE